MPTIRSCVAALLVLAALTLGREAVTLRLVATGALIVLLLWPESLVGPSFQLSFAAITAIVSLHEHPAMRRFFGPQEEAAVRRLGRGLLSLLVTGLAVELVLMPIGLFHFHKAGLYGALANIVAIPLTTFVIMPLEALALLFDLLGAGAPSWWLVEQALRLLLGIAHLVSGAPGAAAALPAMPGAAFALIVAGGLWTGLWRTRWRWLGLAPAAAGLCWTLMTPPPDILVTGDGQHLAIRTGAGRMALLRDRAGEYTRAMLAENGAVIGELDLLSASPDARCSADLCLAQLPGNRRIVATRSRYLVPAAELIALCRSVDIVVSDRRLPAACRPKWLKLDRPYLARSGGIAITLHPERLRSVAQAAGNHPWADPVRIAPPRDQGKFAPPRESDQIAPPRTPPQ